MIDERFPNWDIDVEKGTIYSLKLKRYIGAINKDGYVYVTKQKGYKHCKLHQYIWMCANQADIPKGYDIHHKDHNPLNNSVNNLELIDSTIHKSEHNQNMSEETKRKISEAHKGKHLTDDTKKKMSEAHKGFKHTEESKNKMSNAKINNPKLSKQVVQYTLAGELVKIWCSARECGRNGFNQGNVAACCRGELKKHKGFKWKYL